MGGKCERERGETYMMPNAKTPIKSFFCRGFNCSLCTTGMGRPMIIRSVMMFKMALASHEANVLMQWPSRAGFQNF